MSSKDTSKLLDAYQKIIRQLISTDRNNTIEQFLQNLELD